MEKRNVQIEVCANSVHSALMAQQGGAIRVELCASLTEGGTTPSYGEIAAAKKHLDIEVYPIIRPRGGDFLYSELEFEIMKADIICCRDLKCEGIVTGILTAKGDVDKKRCAELIDLAGPMKVAFHRAFDMTKDMALALEDLIELGFVRVLTSGGKASADDGSDQLETLNTQAAGRISIMPGAGINPDNIRGIIQKTGAFEFHASARRNTVSQMQFRNTALQMGGPADEYSGSMTDPQLVKILLELANHTK